MSHRDGVEKYIDTMSSGDSNVMKSKQKSREVNNNEVDELSKELSEMGCIVDAMKRPPNICVEDCVYQECDEEDQHDPNEEDAYSDEFEEDKSDDECSVVTVSKVERKDCEVDHKQALKLTKSQSIVSSSKAASISGRSGVSDVGSGSTSQSRRVNMSFTNDRLREIERHNHILLTKILSARNTKKSSIPPREPVIRRPVPSAALQRKNQQRKIDHDNMILLKKIQRAKSSAYSIRR